MNYHQQRLMVFVILYYAEDSGILNTDQVRQALVHFIHTKPEDHRAYLKKHIWTELRFVIGMTAWEEGV
jgi:hypothetical protein